MYGTQRQYRLFRIWYIQKIVIGMLAAIGKHKSLNKLRDKYERVSMSVKGNTKHYYYSNYPMPDLKAWCDKEWFNGTVDLKVGEDYFSCPKLLKDIRRYLLWYMEII